MHKLSIVIPAYNEERYIGSLLDKISAVDTLPLGFEKEIVVVDDGSKDRTFEIASSYDGVRVFRQANQGKGAAVQFGIQNCSGDYILVQDADLEYDPRDYIPMLKKLSVSPKSSIYGSRCMPLPGSSWLRRIIPRKHPKQSYGPWIANIILTSWTFILYQRWIWDLLTAYKIYPTDFIRAQTIKTHGFETDHEITSKLIRAGYAIYEVPISYDPRSVEEGKKIGPQDGFIAVWTLLRFRFME